MKVPLYIDLLFIATVLLTCLLFYKSNRDKKFIIVIAVWLTLQSILSLSGFYTNSYTVPPRFLLLAGPPVIAILLLFATRKGRAYSNGLSLKDLALVHLVRLPVEIVLYLLYLNKAVPVTMTFEGGNFDIFSGITAPLIYYLGFIQPKLNRFVLIVWNLVCMGLLFHIVKTAILSLPFIYQSESFNQPNIAILYFPYALLPCCVVPIVLLSHLASLKQLLNKNQI